MFNHFLISPLSYTLSPYNIYVSSSIPTLFSVHSPILFNILFILLIRSIALTITAIPSNKLIPYFIDASIHLSSPYLFPITFHRIIPVLPYITPILSLLFSSLHKLVNSLIITYPNYSFHLLSLLHILYSLFHISLLYFIFHIILSPIYLIQTFSIIFSLNSKPILTDITS